MFTMSFIRKIKRGNYTYLAEVENQWIDGKCVQKHLRYIGKEENGKSVIASSISHAEVEQVKIYGPLLVLHHLANKIKLQEYLGKNYKEILCLVYAHCLDYSSINQMPQWFEKTCLDVLLELPSISEEKLLRALDSIENQDNIFKIENDIFNSTRLRYSLKNSGVIYDVTNTYLYGEKCQLGKYGHDKEGIRGRPLIQIALGVTRAEGIPIFHRTFHGNIHDAKTLEDILTSFKENKIPKSFIVFDRGITSENSVKSLKNMGWEVIGGIALRGNYRKLLQNVIREKNFVSLENRVRMNNTVWYIISQPFAMGEITGQLAWCYNEKLGKDIRESRYDEIEYARECIKNRKPIKDKLQQYFDKKGNLRYDVIKNQEEFDGFSCIFTTKKMTKEELLKIYFGDKDIVEKAFQSLKGVVKLRPVRHWLYNRVIAHVFICYLAYLLLSLMRYHLSSISMSPMEALKELDTMYRVYLRDGKKNFRIDKTVLLTKKQEAILRAFDKRLLKT